MSRVRVPGHLGNCGHKNCVHYRCANRNGPRRDKRPGRKYRAACDTRLSMPMPVEWYRSEGKIPKCPRCGARKWRRDKYRDQREQPKSCRCMGFPYPHRPKTWSSKGTELQYACAQLSPQEIEAICEKIDPVPF